MLPPAIMEALRNNPDFIWCSYWLIAGVMLFGLGVFVLNAIDRLIQLAEIISVWGDPDQRKP
jgi:hypothetical protein